MTLRIDERNLQEPYASTEAFLSVSPKEPLVNMERPPGISSPIKPPSSIRRFSIRPAQLNAQASPTSTTPPLHTAKPPPRWKAGILQRQLGQINLQRRVRAFSLSDVNSSRREKSPAPVSPLAMDNSSKNLANRFVDVSRVNQKTVTIMSPAEEMGMTSKNELRGPAVPAPAATSVNPFVWGFSDKSSAALNEAAISRVEDRRQGKANYDNPTFSDEDSVLAQRFVNLNDTLSRTVQTGMQETNVDVKAEVPLGTEKRNDAIKCLGDNLNEPHDPVNVTCSTSCSKKEKPNVSIDFYKSSRQVIIEKPAVNPFEQYRAMTKSDRKEDMDLKEVKVEYPRVKRDETESQ